jgi:hypothetical protein
MMRFVPALFAVASLATVIACDGVVVGCDFRGDSVNGPEPRCQERSQLGAFGFAESCGVAGGEALEGGCPTEGIVAGCNIGAQGDGSPVIDWYYAPETVESVQIECGNDEFLEP